MTYYKETRGFQSSWFEVADDEHVWRYMTLDKFLSLLVTQELYFPAAAEMEDKWEGVKVPPPQAPNSLEAKFSSAMLKVHNPTRQSTYLSCWHANPNESAAMWDLYARREAGIAISVEWRELRDNLSNNNLGKDFFGGHVNYRDNLIAHEEDWDIHGAYFVKRAAFQHEREVRFVYFPWFIMSDDEEIGHRWSEKTNWPAGESFKLDTKTLSASVFVTPTAADWFVHAVRNVVAKYGVKWPVVKSTLYSPPSF